MAVAVLLEAPISFLLLYSLSALQPLHVVGMAVLLEGVVVLLVVLHLLLTHRDPNHQIRRRYRQLQW
jgi:hypothetical protein